MPSRAAALAGLVSRDRESNRGQRNRAAPAAGECRSALARSARLELFLLGTPRLERDGVPLEFDTRKILALVAYVAVSDLNTEGSRPSRDSLIALLWPELEPSRARAVLRRNLSLLRSALEGEWLVVDRQTVGTDPEAEFWLDVDQFTRLVRAWETHGHPQEQVCPRCVEGLEEAIALYQGDFLEGFGLRDSAPRTY